MTKKHWRIGLIVLIVGLLAFGSALTAFGSYPDPCQPVANRVVTTNPAASLFAGWTQPDPYAPNLVSECDDLQYFKIGLPNGSITDGQMFTHNGLEITIYKKQISGKWYFAFESNYPVYYAWAKGGSGGKYGGNLYYYPDGTTSDCGLSQPGGNWSHLAFYYCELEDATLEVSVELGYNWTVDYEWDIAKSVTPDNWELFKGDTGTSTYTVAVTKSIDWATESSSLSGEFCVENIGMVDAQGVVVDLQVYKGADAIAGAVDIFTLGTLAAGDPEYCDDFLFADFAFEAGATYTVVMTVSLDNGGPYSDSDSVDPVISYGGYNEINVSDTNGSSWGPVSSSTSWNYDETFDCDDMCDDGDGYCTYNNIATIVETGASDDADVTVWCYELAVAKDADATFDRTYNWTITKWGSETELYLTEEGEQVWVDYVVTVNATPVDHNWNVEGEIWITNDAPMAAEIKSVTDIICGSTPAVVTLANGDPIIYPLFVAAESTLTLKYSASLADAVNCNNVVTIVQQNYDYALDNMMIVGVANNADESYSNFAAIAFDPDAPENEYNKCIVVEDDQYGYLGTVCADAVTLPYDFNYGMYVGHVAGEAYDCDGWYSFVNTACFEATDDPTVGDCDSWTVSWIIPCPPRCETAWAAGPRYTPRGNWATYTPYVADSTVILYADQTEPAGTVHFSEAVDGKVTITIELDGWVFDADDKENIAIQDYVSAPRGNPAPGLFAHKFEGTGSYWQGEVPENNFYGVHVNVCTGGVATPPVGDYVLTMATVGSGTATDLTDASPYAAGAVVNIEAVAAQDWVFLQWTTDPTNVGTFGSIYDPVTTFTMPASDVLVTAVFYDQGSVNFRNRTWSHACGTWSAQQSGNVGTTVDTWDISSVTEGAVIDFQFNALTVPDRYVIEYNGQVVLDTGWRGGSTYEGNPLYPGGIAGPGAGQVDAVFTKIAGVNSFKVTVYAPQSGTIWHYWLRCRVVAASSSTSLSMESASLESPGFDGDGSSNGIGAGGMPALHGVDNMGELASGLAQLYPGAVADHMGRRP